MNMTPEGKGGVGKRRFAVNLNNNFGVGCDVSDFMKLQFVTL
jgi:MinD superfamily P-loop ATPase